MLKIFSANIGLSSLEYEFQSRRKNRKLDGRAGVSPAVTTSGCPQPHSSKLPSCVGFKIRALTCRRFGAVK